MVMVDDVFSEEDIEKMMRATIVLEYAVFRERLYRELVTLSQQFETTLMLIPDYPKKEWDLNHQKLVTSSYEGYLDGRYEEMNKYEAFDLLSRLLKPKTLYLGGDIDLYLWKTKNDIHIYNTSSIYVQHVAYYQIGDSIEFNVPQ
jgi:hypothetical protein